jgi:hypothetical protein
MHFNETQLEDDIFQTGPDQQLLLLNLPRKPRKHYLPPLRLPRRHGQAQRLRLHRPSRRRRKEKVDIGIQRKQRGLHRNTGAGKYNPEWGMGESIRSWIGGVFSNSFHNLDLFLVWSGLKTTLYFVKGRLYLRFLYAVWMCVSLSNAFSTSFLSFRQ